MIDGPSYSNAGKPCLVLLSGLLCDRFIWEEVAQNLADVGDIRILSFAGYNSIPEMAEKVLLNAPERVALAGHSMGARVALEVYRQAPSRVERIALLNTGVQPRKEAEVPGRQKLLDLSSSDGMEAVADAWLPPMMSQEALQKVGLVRQLKEMIMRHSPEDFYSQIQALLNRPNGEDVLPSISVPTLLLSGSEDNWSPVSQHEQIQRKVPHSELVALEEVGHMSTVEAPEKVSEAIRYWLSL